MKPEELLYSETHEWVQLDDAAQPQVATVGITAFAVQQLTDLVFLELPEVGRQMAAGDELGEVESVKAVSPLYCPVSGEVIEVNRGLPDRLEVLNEDPYQAGWMAKIRISRREDLSRLMRFEEYQRQCAEEGSHE